MYNDKAFMSFLEERGTKLSAVANALGISLQGLRNKRKGLTKWTINDVYSFADFFSCSVAQVSNIFFAA